ncbi:hypothetical protein SELMODRAFT_116835 [Selaginella moellendorffii]|uniref:Uncharacterized protein n=1 Tax=Selaginella moellendorffii TaxID=88036 RepID=D8SGV0_SELML|nr:hypothetical protein SELMODRAFT_116835 [Selaginella moellendorffii]
MTTEQCVAFLQKKSTTNGDSVFSHLSQLIQFLVATKPDSAVDLLELSLLLKQTRFIPEEGPKVPRSWKFHAKEKFVKHHPDRKPPPLESQEQNGDEEETKEENDPAYSAENYLYDSIFFEAVGMGLGRAENYQVVLAMRQLASTKMVLKMRFFGKFFGIKSNYYVFETTSKSVSLEEAAKLPSYGVEAIPKENGIGPNGHTYWVCSRPGAEFYRLPDVTPLQIKTARQIKKFLTGDLKAEVSAFPVFPGLEENYLRAQIARISATTELAIKGFYKGGAGGGNLEKSEEYAPLGFAELKTLENWVHKNQYLNLQGRTALYVPEKKEEEGEEGGGEEKEEKPPSPEETEVIPERLTSVDTDAELMEGWKQWSFITSSTHKNLKHQVIGLRSILWPGAFTVVTPTGFSNVYIGWGRKLRHYVPPLPPPVMKEFEGLGPERRDLPPIPKPPEPVNVEGEGEEAPPAE